MMKDTAVMLSKRLLVDSIWKTAYLEDLSITASKVEAILSNAPVQTTMEEVMLIVGMKRAWRYLLDNLDYNHSLIHLKRFHERVGVLLFRNAGKLRVVPANAVKASSDPEMPTVEEIYDSIDELNTIGDVELKALKFFCYIMRAQLFDYGNMEVAHLMATKILMEYDVGIFQVPIEKSVEFKDKLIEFCKTGDDTAIIEFMKQYCIVRVNC